MVEEVSFPMVFPLKDRVRAQYYLLTQRPLTLLFFLLWPIVGLAFWVLGLLHWRGFGKIDRWLIVILVIFLPLLPLLRMTLAYARNERLRESFIYKFNKDGVGVDSPSVKLTHPWSAITHVKRGGGFLLFFFSPGCAHCLSLKILDANGLTDRLVEMARQHNVSVL
jgi:hypothetical protein